MVERMGYYVAGFLRFLNTQVNKQFRYTFIYCVFKPQARQAIKMLQVMNLKVFACMDNSL